MISGLRAFLGVCFSAVKSFDLGRQGISRDRERMRICLIKSFTDRPTVACRQDCLEKAMLIDQEMDLGQHFGLIFVES